VNLLTLKGRKSLYRPEFHLPALAMSRRMSDGTTKMLDPKLFGIIPGIAGGAPSGFNQASDLVTQTVDGFDLNDLWAEYQTAMQLQNEARQRVVDFLSFRVTNPQERVPQISSGDFERASEYGEPRGIRPAVAQFTMGYDFEFYDLAARFTWKFLADAPRSQVDAINAMAVEADNRLVFSRVMAALFVNTNRLADINGQQDVNVYSLYNADGTVPPTFQGQTFDGTHTHYLVSGATTVDSTDLDDLMEHLVHHGYGPEQGAQVVLMANRAEVKTIRHFRVADGDDYDFIPAQGSPAQILAIDERVVGTQIAATLRGLTVSGTYGPMVIVEENTIPAGYLAAISTGGAANLNNPVGIREHQNTTLRGLRLVKGPNADYPLIDSFYQRGFGTGIRHRGGAVVMQIKASGSYAPPAAYAALV
jgi:hypothetical protein